ncbi:hypothetical protein NUW58_g3636 [Xylaria curta]|uniref:Uncharacterized protein n=1 Tax=Xylaria curta TaxID=42375 RepID=A0ACC1PA23_9PEZI|nr:hypothetical protein NUW58_g3636 [Xylaria curta]
MVIFGVAALGNIVGIPADELRRLSLEDLYKGKTVKFAANKSVVCGTCKGSGGKDKVKPQTCDRCKGNGMVEILRQMGPGLVARDTAPCDRCQGSGNYFKEKDRCKKCKGKRTVQETKPLEIYIPRGAYQGERIVLEGETDQHPDQTPGNLVFVLVEEPHEIFNRVGNDLSADLDITLAEALGGFSRVVLTHLDGRGIQISHPRGKILHPGQVLKVPGEGMPLKRGDAKGDLYLVVKVEFPEDGWLKDEAAYESLIKLLPGPTQEIKAGEVDEVEYDDDADLDEMGANSGDPRYGEGWEDEDDGEGGAQAQCAQQLAHQIQTVAGGMHKPPPQTSGSGFAKFPHLPKIPTTAHELFLNLRVPRPDTDGTTPTHPITADENPQSRKTKKFNRHQSDRFKCLSSSWRKPKGIDNAVRRRFRGRMAMPSIGYGSNRKTRHMAPNGLKAFIVNNTKDVELLLMHKDTYAAEIAHNVSSRKRVDIIARAKQLGVKVTNAKAKVTTEI